MQSHSPQIPLDKKLPKMNEAKSSLQILFDNKFPNMNKEKYTLKIVFGREIREYERD